MVRFFPDTVYSALGDVSATAVNVRDAGEGTLEISICGPSGQNISNSVTTLGPGHFLVSYIPLEAGSHRANVTFNGESVCGRQCCFPSIKQLFYRYFSYYSVPVLEILIIPVRKTAIVVLVFVLVRENITNGMMPLRACICGSFIFSIIRNVVVIVIIFSHLILTFFII